MNQIERIIGEFEGPGCIHHTKMRVLSSLRGGNGAGIIDHEWADIETSYLHLWIRLRYIKNPGAGTASNVKHIMALADIESLGKKSSANPGGNASLPAQAAHLCCIFYFNGILSLFLGRSI